MDSAFRQQIEEMTDEELTTIFRNQRDYQGDYVTIVSEELGRRGMDISTIVALDQTELEVREIKSDARSTIIALRVVAILLVAGSVTSGEFFWQILQSNQTTIHALLGGSGLVFCGILVFVSIAIWFKKRWACVTAIAILSLNAVILSLLSLYAVKHLYRLNIPLLVFAYAIILICISVLYSGIKVIQRTNSEDLG